MVQKDNFELDFSVTGHENILSEHKSTIEFTKDNYLTKKGDCILGVNTIGDFEQLKNLNFAKCEIIVSIEKLKDKFCGFINTDFSSKTQLVIRRSSYVDSRTGIILANKSAKDIDRRIVNKLQKPSSTAKITIKPLEIKNLVFDFDDTLEVWSEHETVADSVMIDYVLKYLIYKEQADDVNRNILLEELGCAKGRFIRKKWSPKYYARSVWLKDAIKKLGLSVPDKIINDSQKLYWKTIESLVTLYPGTLNTLKQLKKKYKLFIYSDSDGEKSLKIKRIKNLGIYDLFDGVYTSDDTGYNKPHPNSMKRLFSLSGINPFESAFIGDHPEADHIGSKQFGMTTILLVQGPYASNSKNEYNYVDFQTDSIKNLPKLLNSIGKKDYKNYI